MTCSYIWRMTEREDSQVALMFLHWVVMGKYCKEG